MASIQLVLMNKPNRAVLFPLAIRIIKDRKPSYLFTGQYIEMANFGIIKISDQKISS